MQSSFLTKLYELKPFKVVNSPENIKHNQQELREKQTSSANKLLHRNHLSTSPFTPQSTVNKQNSPYIDKIDAQLFNNLSSSIDNLFSKIQKIKQEFEYQECSTSRRKYSREKHKIKKHSSNKVKTQHNLPQISQQPISQFIEQETAYMKNLFKKYSKKSSQQTNDTNYGTAYSTLTLQNHPSVKQRQSFDLTMHPPKIYQQSGLRQSVQMSKKISMTDIELGKCVGSGKFGDVHICRHKPTGMILALKKIFKSTIKQYGMIQQFLKQLKIQYLLNHPNIPKFYGHFDDEYHIFLLMEYAEEGTLMNQLKKDQEYVSKAIYQILSAVAHLHRNKIAHRDIKPQNIVLSNGILKLCDFGWSAIFDTDMKKTFCGTLDYVSPEMKDKGEYTTSVDIWSIGVLTFQLLTGFPPHKKEIDKWKMLSGNIRDKWRWDVIFPPEVSQLAKNFISGLLKQDPDQRLTIRGCLSHQFIQKYNKTTGLCEFQFTQSEIQTIICQ